MGNSIEKPGTLVSDGKRFSVTRHVENGQLTDKATIAPTSHTYEDLGAVTHAFTTGGIDYDLPPKKRTKSGKALLSDPEVIVTGPGLEKLAVEKGAVFPGSHEMRVKNGISTSRSDSMSL